MPITSHITQDQNTKTDTLTIYNNKSILDTIIYNHMTAIIYCGSVRSHTLPLHEFDELIERYCAFDYNPDRLDILNANILFVQRCNLNSLELYISSNEVPIFNVTINNGKFKIGKRLIAFQFNRAEWRFITMLLRQMQQTVKNFKEM